MPKTPTNEYQEDANAFPQGSLQYVRGFVMLDAYDDARLLASGEKGYDNEDITREQLRAAFRCGVVTTEEVAEMYARGLRDGLSAVGGKSKEKFEDLAGDPLPHPSGDDDETDEGEFDDE